MKTFSARERHPGGAGRWWTPRARPSVVSRVTSRWRLGKPEPIYTLHMDTGDFVIVINAEKIS
jgi:ribosomal protein L13